MKFEEQFPELTNEEVYVECPWYEGLSFKGNSKCNPFPNNWIDEKDSNKFYPIFSYKTIKTYCLSKQRVKEVLIENMDSSNYIKRSIEELFKELGL